MVMNLLKHTAYWVVKQGKWHAHIYQHSPIQRQCIHAGNTGKADTVNTQFTCVGRWRRQGKCNMCIPFKPQSDIHCSRSAISPRPKFKTIAEVPVESQLGFAVGQRLVGDRSATDRGLVADWSATSWGPLCDLMQLVADRSVTAPRLVADQSPKSQLKTVIKKKNIDNIF